MKVYLIFEYQDFVDVYSNYSAAQEHCNKILLEYEKTLGKADRSGMIKVVEVKPKDRWLWNADV